MLSIIIVTFKKDDLLEQCLASIKKACVKEMPEVVVVDNAALESTRAVVDAYPSMYYVPAPENLGFAGGNNLGLEHCHGDYVLLLNNDTIIQNEPFTELITYLETHIEVAVVQGKMIVPNPEPPVLDACGSFLTPLGVQYHRWFRKPDFEGMRSYPVFTAKGACLMFRKSIINDVGGYLFHPSFFMYYEESDFCHRVWLSGNEVHFVPSTPIIHLLGQSFGTFSSQTVWSRYLSNTFFSYLSLFSIRGIARILPLFLAMNLVNTVKGLLAGNLKPAKAFFSAFALTWRRRHEIKSVRKLQQSNRKISDKELFTKIMQRPRLSYYWYSATGKTNKYAE